MVIGFTTTCAIIAYITTNIVSLNLTHGEVYSIQHYVIKFVSDLWQVLVFSPCTPVSSSKPDRHDITEILLKVALNVIILILKKILEIFDEVKICFGGVFF